MPWAKNKDIEKIRKAIVDTVEELSHWGERIPKVWNDCEKFLKENQKKQIISRNDVTMFFRNNYPETEKDINVDDILKFYHEVGLILHFPNESLKDVIIVDVQWFVHAFKHIITDPKHFDKHCGNKNEFKSFNDFGILSDTLLQKIWTYNNKTTKSCIQHKSKIIPYMNKLGLIAQIDYESANQTDAEKSEIVDEVKYYIPSMNKMNFDLSSISKIMSGQRTSILHFKFTDFIPHFFFYRLIVACIGKWKLLDKGKRLFKDIAFYITDGQGYHNIAIAINESCIQVQMFRRDNRELEIEHTLSCREMIEEMIGRITSTFHKSVKYVTGFSCKDINLTEESEENFLEERDIINLVHEFACPNHVDKNHQVDGAKLL
ncbi:uncharacterized protein LOC134239553 [Saccostrea cucullata]|uniref:uncharacterized protein LOC134239553 n=1 Tax=Saccostrea cuccullata TaxID=36930 RepID=UPI002ED0ABE9